MHPDGCKQTKREESVKAGPPQGGGAAAAAGEARPRAGRPTGLALTDGPKGQGRKTHEPPAAHEF